MASWIDDIDKSALLAGQRIIAVAIENGDGTWFWEVRGICASGTEGSRAAAKQAADAAINSH